MMIVQWTFSLFSFCSDKTKNIHTKNTSMTCRRSSSSSSSIPPPTLKSHTHTNRARFFRPIIPAVVRWPFTHTQHRGRQASSSVDLPRLYTPWEIKKVMPVTWGNKKNKNSAHAGNHGFVYCVCVCRRSYLDKKVALQHTHTHSRNIPCCNVHFSRESQRG